MKNKTMILSGITGGLLAATAVVGLGHLAARDGKKEFRDRFLGAECSVVPGPSQGNGRNPARLTKKEIIAERVGELPPGALKDASKHKDALTLTKK